MTTTVSQDRSDIEKIFNADVRSSSGAPSVRIEPSKKIPRWAFFFFKQKTAYELTVRDWSSDVCSSDLRRADQSDQGRSVARRVGDPGRVTGQRSDARSEERRVGKECGLLCRSRWSP